MMVAGIGSTDVELAISPWPLFPSICSIRWFHHWFGQRVLDPPRFQSQAWWVSEFTSFGHHS